MKTKTLTALMTVLLFLAATLRADYFQNVQKGETHVQDSAGGQMVKGTLKGSEDTGGLPIVDTGNGLRNNGAAMNDPPPRQLRSSLVC